jgi:micrococcal nuclease
VQTGRISSARHALPSILATFLNHQESDIMKKSGGRIRARVPRSAWRLGATLAAMTVSISAIGAPAMEGEVVAVENGDTLTVLVGQKEVRVLLAEIDAPELRQSFGDKAAESLADLCLKKPASVQAMGQAGSGRIIGRVKCEEVDAGAAQVERGMAWVSSQRRRTASPLFFLQDRAQRSREGLWKEASPVAPWVWRKTRGNMN